MIYQSLAETLHLFAPVTCPAFFEAIHHPFVQPDASVAGVRRSALEMIFLVTVMSFLTGD